MIKLRKTESQKAMEKNTSDTEQLRTKHNGIEQKTTELNTTERNWTKHSGIDKKQLN